MKTTKSKKANAIVKELPDVTPGRVMDYFTQKGYVEDNYFVDRPDPDSEAGQVIHTIAAEAHIDQIQTLVTEKLNHGLRLSRFLLQTGVNQPDDINDNRLTSLFSLYKQCSTGTSALQRLVGINDKKRTVLVKKLVKRIGKKIDDAPLYPLYREEWGSLNDLELLIKNGLYNYDSVKMCVSKALNDKDADMLNLLIDCPGTFKYMLDASDEHVHIFDGMVGFIDSSIDPLLKPYKKALSKPLVADKLTQDELLNIAQKCVKRGWAQALSHTLNRLGNTLPKPVKSDIYDYVFNWEEQDGFVGGVLLVLLEHGFAPPNVSAGQVKQYLRNSGIDPAKHQGLLASALI